MSIDTPTPTAGHPVAVGHRLPGVAFTDGAGGLPSCMTAVELGRWDEANAWCAANYRAESPCMDCTALFQVEMQAAGLCNALTSMTEKAAYAAPPHKARPGSLARVGPTFPTTAACTRWTCRDAGGRSWPPSQNSQRRDGLSRPRPENHP